MELMVVLVIVGILATGVVFMFADPAAKVKAAAFEMRGDLNLARAEAVRRNTNILVQFIDTAQETCSKETTTVFTDCFAGGNSHGYVICFDENGDDDCSDEGGTVDELDEKIVKAVLFQDSVRYYEFGATLPAAPSGPSTCPLGVALASNNGITLFDPALPGTEVDFLTMNFNGTSSHMGSVVVYLPGEASALTVKGRPFAVVVDNMSSGQVRLERWQPNIDDWFRR
jgi:Tfp pilus assembly protein FimT